MARARNIKPGLFKNELLGTEDPCLSLLFIGMWCLADKEGRLEDRPMRINAEIFPYRGFSYDQIDTHLTQLHNLGFIQRYTVRGMPLIYIPKFVKHQKPHHTEKDSELPPQPIDTQEVTEITVNSPLNNGDNPCDNALIPDSPSSDLLISDFPRIQESSESDAPEEAPLPKNNSSSGSTTRSAASDRKDHPAIQMVRAITNRYPSKDIWDKIITEVGDNPDVELYKASYVKWRTVNGNPMTYAKWLFEPARTGYPVQLFGDPPLPPKRITGTQYAEMIDAEEAALRNGHTP